MKFLGRSIHCPSCHYEGESRVTGFPFGKLIGLGIVGLLFWEFSVPLYFWLIFAGVLLWIVSSSFRDVCPSCGRGFLFGLARWRRMESGLTDKEVSFLGMGPSSSGENTPKAHRAFQAALVYKMLEMDSRGGFFQGVCNFFGGLFLWGKRVAFLFVLFFLVKMCVGLWNGGELPGERFIGLVTGKVESRISLGDDPTSRLRALGNESEGLLTELSGVRESVVRFFDNLKGEAHGIVSGLGSSPFKEERSYREYVLGNSGSSGTFYSQSELERARELALAVERELSTNSGQYPVSSRVAAAADVSLYVLGEMDSRDRFETILAKNL